MLSPMRTPVRRQLPLIIRSAFAAMILLPPLLGPATPVLAAEDPPPYLYGWGTSGTDPGEFNQPRGVALDDEGNVYVVDSANCRIQKFDACGGYIAEFGSSGSGDDQFILPFDVAVDSSGDVWVSDYSNHCVKKFHDAGGNTYEYDDTVIGTPGTSGAGDGVLNVPWGITTDDDDNLYVADSGNHRIQKFDSSGTLVTIWGTPGSGDGQFNSPTEVAVDSDGNVCVADNNNWRIQKFVWDDEAGGGAGAYVFDNQWASGDGGLWGLAVDSSGDVYVSDHGNDLIRKYDGAGTVLTSWGTSGSCDSCLDGPIGIAVHPDGRVFVADMNNSRIQVFTPSPWLTYQGSEENDHTTGIAVDTDGYIYITGETESAWRTEDGEPVRGYSGYNDAFVAKLDHDGDIIWYTFLGGAAADSGTGIAVDADRVYITGLSENLAWSQPGDSSPVHRSHAGSVDAFVAVLDSNDGNMEWYTFLGGELVDFGCAIDVDNEGSIFVAGTSEASWVDASTPARAYSGGKDVFAAGLDSDGSPLWHTFLGGTGEDCDEDLCGIAVNGGNVYVTATSASDWSENPVRPYSSGHDAFVAKLDADDGTLSRHTFLGGGDTMFGDVGRSLTLDTNGDVYITGSSENSWGDPLQEHAGGANAFVARLTSSLELTWHTFLGDGGTEGRGIAAAMNGGIYVVGCSESSWGSPDDAWSSQLDAFVAKLSGGGTLTWNTFSGGDGAEFGDAVATDIDGGCVVAGYANKGTWASGRSPVRPYSAVHDGFVVQYLGPASVSFDLDLQAGWNMVSVPLVMDGPAVEDVFWDSVVVYTWDAEEGVYIQVHEGGDLTDIEPGRAYWVKVTDENDGTLTVLGAPVTADAWTVHLYEGWNMIGGPYSATAISKNDLYDGGASALRPEQMYWWDPSGQYVDEDELEQGKGYWIAATAECDLIIQASS